MSDTLATYELRDGVGIITMDDGNVLRADVFRPMAEGRYPVIMTYGPYGKWVAFQEGYQTAWDIMCRENPDAVSGTSNRYANWEVVDPEKWVPDGYVCVRVDSRVREEVLDRRTGFQVTAQGWLVEAGQPLDDLVELGLRAALLLDLRDVVRVDRRHARGEDPVPHAGRLVGRSRTRTCAGRGRDR